MWYIDSTVGVDCVINLFKESEAASRTGDFFKP